MPATVLVTGATGFIGRALVARLSAAGLRIRCLARPGAAASLPDLPGVEAVGGDLLDHASLENALRGVGLVWHLGALVRPRGRLVSRTALRKRFYAVNAAATGVLAAAAARAGVKRLIYFSSISALGPGENLSDAAEPRPLTVYGKSKLAGETALREAARGSGLEHVILRPAMIYGPGAPGWNALFAAVRRPAAVLPGGGGNMVSVCGLENLLDAALLAADRAENGASFNISEGSLSARRLLLLAGSLLGRSPTPLYLPVFFLKAAAAALDGLLGAAGLYMPGFIGADRARLGEACASWSHDAAGIRALGWRPAVSTEAGLAASLKP